MPDPSRSPAEGREGVAAGGQTVGARQPRAEGGGLARGPLAHPRGDVEGLRDLAVGVAGKERQQEPGQERRHRAVDTHEGLAPLGPLGRSVGPGAELEGEDREGAPADPAEDGALVTSSREHDPPAVVLDEHAVRSLRPFAVVGGELVGADRLDPILRETQVTGGGGGYVWIIREEAVGREGGPRRPALHPARQGVVGPDADDLGADVGGKFAGAREKRGELLAGVGRAGQQEPDEGKGEAHRGPLDGEGAETRSPRRRRRSATWRRRPG